MTMLAATDRGRNDRCGHIEVILVLMRLDSLYARSQNVAVAIDLDLSMNFSEIPGQKRPVQTGPIPLTSSFVCFFPAVHFTSCVPQVPPEDVNAKTPLV